MALQLVRACRTRDSCELQTNCGGRCMLHHAPACALQTHIHAQTGNLQVLQLLGTALADQALELCFALLLSACQGD